MKIKLEKALIIDGEEKLEIEIKEADISLDILAAMNKPIMERDPFNLKNVLWRPRSEVEQTMVLLASILGASEREVGKLGVKDLGKIMEVVEPFLDSQAPVGKSK